MPPQADGLDKMAAMADRSSRKHRAVPPPKRAGLPPQRAHEQPAPPDEGEATDQAVSGVDSAADSHEPAPPTEVAEEPTAAPAPKADPARPGARARSRRDTGSRITWTAEAKALRSALTTYQAQLRKLDERKREVRKLARKVSAEDLPVIVQRVAQDTNGDRGQLGDAAGLTRNE